MKTKNKKPAAFGIRAGEKVFIRTVTMYYTGQIVSEDELFIYLEDAAWIACTKRFSETLSTGKCSEVEPFPSWVAIAKLAIVDISPWSHDLPRIVQ